MMHAFDHAVILGSVGLAIREGRDMAETAGMETGGSWILGLDTGRSDRERIARRIEHSSSGRVLVRDLADPQLRRWHADAFGAGSSPLPTLFEVNGDSVRAWEGPRMGIALRRVLGPAVTLHVLRDLNVEHVSSEAPWAAASQRSSPLTLSRSRELSGSELSDAVRLAVETPDVKNLAGPSLASPADLAAARPIAFEHVLRGGTRVRAAVFKLSVTRLLAHHLTTSSLSLERSSMARLWRVEGGRSVLVNTSEGGDLQPLPEATEASHPRLSRDGSVVCTAMDLRCVLNLAEAGGGCSAYFYALPETSIAPAPPGGACAGGYQKPSRRCCAAFGRRISSRTGNSNHKL